MKISIFFAQMHMHSNSMLFASKNNQDFWLQFCDFDILGIALITNKGILGVILNTCEGDKIMFSSIPGPSRARRGQFRSHFFFFFSSDSPNSFSIPDTLTTLELQHTLIVWAWHERGIKKFCRARDVTSISGGLVQVQYSHPV